MNVKKKYTYREGGGVMFCKKSGLSEVADTECIFSPEDVEIVSVLVSENWRNKNQQQKKNR